MSQPRLSASSWSCSPTVDISSEQWTRWHDPANHPSPYFVPEWALFWTQAWRSTTAEVWRLGDLAVSTVRRRRMGRTWVFALPYGTPGGWLQEASTEVSEEESFAGLIEAIADKDTVEVALSIGGHAPEIPGWKRTVISTQTWTIDRTGADDSEIKLELSDSHRRNIEKGARLKPEIRPVADRQAALGLFESWPLPSEHRSRIVLNPPLSAALMSTFALSSALRWLTAWIGEKPVATSLWLVLHDRAVYVDGATARDRQFAGVSHFLFSHVLSELYREGVRHFDLGGGPAGKSSAGLARFKEGWGGMPETRIEAVYRRGWYHSLRKLL